MPTIGTQASNSIFSTPAEQKASRQGIEALSQPTSEEDGTAERLGRALKDLQQLLRPEHLTQ
jgi:hypothetical protein